MNAWEKQALWEYHIKLWLIHHWWIYIALFGAILLFSVIAFWKEFRK